MQHTTGSWSLSVSVREKREHSIPRGKSTKTIHPTRRFRSGMPLDTRVSWDREVYILSVQVTYKMSKHHSVTPGWLRSWPEEMTVPVVGSRRLVPMLSRYRDKNSAGKYVMIYIASAPFEGGRELRLNKRRSKMDRMVGTNIPRRRTLMVCSFCPASDRQQ